MSNLDLTLFCVLLLMMNVVLYAYSASIKNSLLDTLDQLRRVSGVVERHAIRISFLEDELVDEREKR